jgi:hypothetical protein
MAQQQSLFGPSIYDIQQEQIQQDQANALAQARLTPYQSIRAGMGMAGTQAGRAIGGLFGVEDPRLKEASARQELKNSISAQWDGQDPVEAYRIMAREATRLGLTQEAIAAAAQVKQAEEAKAKAELGTIKTTYEIGKLAAETQRAIRQATEAMQSKAPVVQLQKARQELRDAMQNATTELEKEEIRQQITEIDSAINLATTRAPKEEKQESFGADREAISREMYGKRFGDLTQLEQQAVNKREAETSKKGTKIDVSINQDKGINTAKVKRLDDLENSAVAADSVLTNVNAISSVLNNAFTGVGAGVALKAGQIANALGVQVTGTTESEQLNQLLAKLAQGQARTLPGSLSEKELMFLREAIGTGGMTKQTLQAMLRRMREDAISDKEAYKDAFKFQQGGGNLNNYDFAESRTKARSTARRISDLLEKATPEQRRQLGY